MIDAGKECSFELEVSTLQQKRMKRIDKRASESGESDSLTDRDTGELRLYPES